MPLSPSFLPLCLGLLSLVACGGGEIDQDEDGHSVEAGDCDDLNASIHPDADETCDGQDNDCDGEVDEADAVDTMVWFEDADWDGYGDMADWYGDMAMTEIACDAPLGFVGNDLDCNDADPTIHPGQYEICDGIDNNCDGFEDESTALDAPSWYADSDSDGYGDPEVSTTSCEAPSGYVADNTDCDDSNGSIYPGADCE